MTNTDDPDRLLTVCIQDLWDGEAAAARRLPDVVAHARDAALADALALYLAQIARQAEQLHATGRAEGGEANLWMQGILDDAERDTQSIAPGPLLDAAMIGAVRKAKAAKIVSYETATALAARIGDVALATLLGRIRDTEVAGDHRLAELLDARAAASAAAQ